jgi:phospholipase C
MHPPYSGLLSAVAEQRGILDQQGVHFDNPSSLIAGEDLLARIYHAIRSSSSATGSNHFNTTLLVTFDEHGGTYDHVPPPPAVPPGAAAAPGQFGFTFHRSGVRIPTLAISAWIPERTVVTGEYRTTSLIATMRERWNLGAPFTARNVSARSFAPVLSRPTPRPPEDWPEVTARPVPKMPQTLVPLDAPLGLLGKSLFFAVLGLAHGLGAAVPDIKPEDTITGAQAVAIGHEALGELFPMMRDQG